ncbi:MAG: ABC transporter substrate-binding protein [Candidatus Muiribacteriota bacterium]
MSKANKKFWLVLMAGFILGVFFSLGNNEKEVNENKEILPQTKEKKVIALLPNVQEMISAVGGTKYLVGVTQHSVYPEDIKEIPVIGGYQGFNYEKISIINPDYIFGTSASQEAGLELEKIGFHYIQVKDESIEDIHNSMIQIGQILNLEEEALLKVNSLRQKFEKLKAKASNMNKSVLMLLGDPGELKNLYVAGPDTFLDEIITELGFKNAYEGDIQYPSLSAENILKINPDYIIILDERNKIDDSKKKEIIATWDSLDVQAVENNNVKVLNGDFVFLPGPRYIKTVEKLMVLLNK